jgi:acyl-CoA thioesterase-1
MIKKFSRLISPTFRPVLFCLVITALVPACNHTVFAADKTTETILVLGDSLSGAYGIDIDEGWVALLQQQLVAQGYDYRVINASVSGDTSRTGLSRIDDAMKSHKPQIVIIALGGNDGLRGLAFSETASSLGNIIERCIQDHAEILLVGVRMPPNYGAAYNQKFADVYQGLAQRYNIPFVPKMLDQVADRPELMQADGIHPKAEAQTLVMENVWSGLKLILEK